MLAESPEFFCVALTPSTRPVLPPDFDENWYGLEGTATHDWRWSSGDASIAFYNSESAPRQTRVSFKLETLQPRRLEISIASKKVYDDKLEPGVAANPVDVIFVLSPGKNILRFKSSVAGITPGTGDPRKLAFALDDFRLRE